MLTLKQRMKLMMQSELTEDRIIWLQLRSRYIGSSDSPGILGCGYSGQNRRTVWASKVGSVEYSQPDPKEKELELMDDGASYEQLVVEMFRIRNPGVEVVSKPFDLRTNPQFPNLCASLDSYIVGEDGKHYPLEAKWIMHPNRRVGKNEWKNEWEDGGCPLKHQFQSLHQQIVLGVNRGVVVGCVRGEYCERWIEYDDDVVKWMLEQYDEFWQYVVSGEPPPVVETDFASREVVKKTAIELGVAASEVVREIAELQSQASKLELKIESKLTALATKVGTAEYAIMDDGSAVKFFKSSIQLMRGLPRNVRVPI